MINCSIHSAEIILTKTDLDQTSVDGKRFSSLYRNSCTKVFNIGR